MLEKLTFQQSLNILMRLFKKDALKENECHNMDLFKSTFKDRL